MSSEPQNSHPDPTPDSPAASNASESWWQRVQRFFKSLTFLKELEAAVVGALITGFATLAIAFVNLMNGLNAQLDRPFQIQESLTKTQITVEEHRQTVLMDYLSTVTELLVKDDSESKEKIGILRALTHAVLQDLDAPRKRYVMMVLYDAGLIRLNASPLNVSGMNSFLSSANLVGVNLQGLNFQDTDFRKTDLRGANFQGVDLSGSNLQGADFSGTDLRAAVLDTVELEGTDLTSACYNGRTQFDPNFDPVAAGMQKVPLTAPCTPQLPNLDSPADATTEISKRPSAPSIP